MFYRSDPISRFRSHERVAESRRLMRDPTASGLMPSELRSYRKILFCLLGSAMLLEDIVGDDKLV